MTIIPLEVMYFRQDCIESDMEYLDERFAYQSSLEDLDTEIGKELNELPIHYANLVIKVHDIYKKRLDATDRYNDYADYIQELPENAEDEQLHKMFEYRKARHWLNNRWSD